MGWLWFFIFSVLVLAFSGAFWEASNHSIEESYDIPEHHKAGVYFWAAHGMTIAIVIIVIVGIINALASLGSSASSAPPPRIDRTPFIPPSEDFGVPIEYKSAEDQVSEELRRRGIG